MNRIYLLCQEMYFDDIYLIIPTSIIVGALRFPLATLGIIEASTTLKFSIPKMDVK